MERIELGNRKGVGSVSTSVWAESTSRFLGECRACPRPIAVQHSGASKHLKVPCPHCGSEVLVERLFAVKTATSCDGACMSAYGPSCSCGCGGDNHGKRWTEVESRGDKFESALEGYRALQQEKARKAQSRRDRENEAAKQWCREYVELVEALEELAEYDGILDDFLHQVRGGKVLSQNKLDLAEKLIPEAIEERERLQRQEARKEIQRWIGEEGEQVTITGVVEKAIVVDGYRRDSVKRMLIIAGTGEHEGVTVKALSNAKPAWALAVGQQVTVTGVVKYHGEYEEVKQTRLGWCKFL